MCIPEIKNHCISNFKVNGHNSNISENRRVDPQFYIVGIFRCLIRVQQALKPLETNFRPFPYFWKIFRFFQTDSYTLKASPQEFFLKKKMRHTEKPILPKFQLYKCYTYIYMNKCFFSLKNETLENKFKWRKMDDNGGTSAMKAILNVPHYLLFPSF